MNKVGASGQNPDSVEDRSVQSALTVGNTTISLWSKGQGSPLVVFMAGGLCDHRAWLPQVETIGEKCEVLTLDPRGMGQSQAVGPYDITQQADDVARAIMSRRREAAVIVSHSIGGYAALLLNRRYPSLVRANMFVDAPLSATGAHTTSLVDAIRQTGTLAPLTGMVDSMSALADKQVRDVIRDMMLTCPIEVALGMLSGLEIVTDEIDRLVLEAAEKPCSVIWPGPKPMGGDPEWLGRVAPTIEQRFLDGAGHFAQLERPDEIVLLLEEFLSELT